MIRTMPKKPLNYGVLNDGSPLARFEDCVLKASEVFSAQSGKFVKPDGTDDFAVAGSGDTILSGWAVTHAHTVSASVVERADLICDINGRFLIPADAAVTAALKGLTCDLIVAANIQKADIGESNEDVIVIYDVNVEHQLCEVGLSGIKLFPTGVV
jgi:hypothetical protein